MSLTDIVVHQIPRFFQYLIHRGSITMESVLKTSDGFFMLSESVASILSSADIDTFPDREDREFFCRNFFDDWFLFAITGREVPVYGLIKMREQEYDREMNIHADGDTPGVTVSFIDFDTDVLMKCLEDSSAVNRKNLGMEINRVVAYPKQKHHPILKDYFIRPEAEAPYLIADVFVRLIASFSQNGILSVPEDYLKTYRKRGQSKRFGRIPDFLEQNNQDAGRIICAHQRIYIAEAEKLTEHEKLSIMATHTGNVSVHSFAAEIRYHAMFLNRLANIRLPFIGSPYASAVRADMSIGDKEFQGPAPYYNLSGKLVRDQRKYHKI